MDIKDEINKFSEESDKKALLWLFDKYHLKNEWSFVADCTFNRYGIYSYQVNRKWKPTKEGQIIYDNKEKL